MKFDLEVRDRQGIFYNKRFKNGCQLILEKLPWSLTSSIGVWVKVGSKYESIEEQGISHLIEHLLFRGTQTRSGQEIVEYMESVGGEINAYTERELTCYSAKVLREDVIRALELLYDLVTQPLFDEEHIAKEKEIILREIEESEEDYHTSVHDLLIRNMVLGPLGYPIYGDKNALNLISKNQIGLFYNKFYRPENMVIAIAGSFNEEEVLQQLLRTFGSLPEQTYTKNCPIVSQVESKFIAKNENIEQTYFCLGTEGLKQTDPDRVVMFIISSILGEGMSSRLYKGVREEAGLAYTIYTYYTLYAELGTFIITGVTRPDELKFVLTMVNKEINDFCVKKISDRELTMAKAKLKGNFFFNLEPVVNRMIRIAKLNDWHNRHFVIDEEVQLVDQVKVEDVRRVSKRLFADKKWSLAIIGKDVSTLDEGELLL